MSCISHLKAFYRINKKKNPLYRFENAMCAGRPTYTRNTVIKNTTKTMKYNKNKTRTVEERSRTNIRWSICYIIHSSAQIRNLVKNKRNSKK